MAKRGRKPIILREECKEVQHYVCLAHKIEAIQAAMDSDESCLVFMVGQPKPLIVHHSARELSIEAFGHALSYRTRRTSPPERIYINNSLVNHVCFLKTGLEPIAASKGQRSVTIVMDSGQKFTVIENSKIAIRSLFASNAVNFIMPVNKVLKDTSKENPY